MNWQVENESGSQQFELLITAGQMIMQNKPDIGMLGKVLPSITIHEELGEGGFKVAFRAEIKGKIEALKVIEIPFDKEDSSVEDENRRRAYREIDILRRANSPYLVKLGSLAAFDCDLGGNKYVCYSEELIQGESLRKRIREGWRPTQQELITICLCLLAAIEEFDGMNVIHRDIKPENVIALPQAERPFVLLDMGIAFVVGGTMLTRGSGRIPGTLYYIAPEMLDADFRQSLDKRADLYAMGLTLYEYASSVNPFARTAEPEFTTLYRIKHDNPLPLIKHRADLDGSFCGLVDQLIKKLPALRPANLAMLRKTMESLR